MPSPVQDFLISQCYPILRTLLFLCLISFFINFKEIVNLFKKIEKKTWFILLLILLTGLIIRVWIIPHTHHVYFDGFEHVNIAGNMAHQGNFFLTRQGSFGDSQMYRLPYWPPGYHALLALVFSVFGSSEFVAYNLSAVIGSLSIPVIFLIIYLLFQNKNISLLGTFLFSIIPVHLKYSGSISLEITSLFFILLAMLAILIYSRLRNIKSLFLLIFLSAFAVYIRPENIILLFFIPFFYFLIGKKEDFFQSPKKVYSHIAIFLGSMLILLIPYFLHMYWGVFIEPPPGWGQGFYSRLENLRVFLTNNLLFWFSNFHPLSFTLLAIFGAFRLIKINKKILLILFAWFLVFLLFYSSYHIGKFMGSTDGDRYALYLYISLIVFAGVGFYELVKLVSFKQIFLCLAIAYLIFDVARPLVRSIEPTFSRDVYRQYQFILSMKDKIPEHLYVVSPSPPSIISSINRPAVDPYIFYNMSDKPKEAILFKDFWYVQDYNQELRRELLEIKESLKRVYDFELLSQVKLPSSNEISFIKLKWKD